MNIAEEARIVPGAWNTIKKRHAARCAADSKYKWDYERNAERLAERQTRSLARTFAKGGRGLRDLREIPGFAAEKAGKEYDIFNKHQPVISDFDQEIKRLLGKDEK